MKTDPQETTAQAKPPTCSRPAGPEAKPGPELDGVVQRLKKVLLDPLTFSSAGRLYLRRYQEETARAIIASVIHQRGYSFVVLFPRQSGKNELQAQIETYLLTLLQQRDAEIIKVSPTWKPQSLNAMRRLQRILERNLLTRDSWVKEQGYIYRIDRARIFFLSGGPEANIVGATASTLLEVDEAQDVLIAKFDKDIAPMAASTNATRVFWGTAWTSKTLLAREMRAAQEAERSDGVRRVFRIDADIVSAEVPAYGKFVADQIAKLGRNHPMVKTQFFSEEIDAEGGMFPPGRRALMVGAHARQHQPTRGKLYAFLLDVAGEDEGVGDTENMGGHAGPPLQNAGRDSTALTIVEVDLSGLANPGIKAPIYRVVERMSWTGVKHTRIFSQILGLIECWGAQWVVVDATGVGAGMASFLERAQPGRILPFLFNGSTKSKLGWDFIGIVETARFKDWAPTPNTNRAVTQDRPYGNGSDNLREEFFHQLELCQMTILPGPDHKMRWGVPDGTRDPATGELVHDDLVLSAALVGVLDQQEWSLPGQTAVIAGRDPLHQMDQGEF